MHPGARSPGLIEGRRLPNGEPEVTLADVCAYNEILAVDAENEDRAYAQARRESAKK